MQLYHYRSIPSALLELGNGTFHFAAREELNDPIEGYVQVFWQGDRAAWEGLLRNYICSLSQAMELYLLDGDADMLQHRSLVVDLHGFDHAPLGAVWQELGEAFLADETLQKLTVCYGEHELKVYEEELQLLLFLLHRKAMVLCVRKGLECGMLTEEEPAQQLLELFGRESRQELSFALPEEVLGLQEQRAQIARLLKDTIEDIREQQYMRLGLEDEAFLYGQRAEQGAQEALQASEAHRRRKWLSIAVDFPRVYVEQLKEMIYPASYVVCFSRRSDDSAMWGNYAANHQGVCLIYETGEDNRLELTDCNQRFSLEAKPVAYGGELIERNFFETFGRLTEAQIRTWLTGSEGRSRYYARILENPKWRQRYWEAFDAKTYRKLPAWSHEEEYRLAIADTLYRYEDPMSRNLAFDPQALKGIIWGIRTSEYDRLRILAALQKRGIEPGALTFYQAEYDGGAQQIRVRKKGMR